MTDQEDYVLLVEDNADDVILTLRSFKKNSFPYKIVVVNDGAEALNHLFGDDPQSQREIAKVPKVILLDLNLPKVQGLEVLKRLRADPLLKNVPAVILTSSNEEKDRTEAENLGADLYIRKPINFNDFDDVAQQIKDLLSARAPGV